MNHLDDEAELYALGMLDPAREAEIEAHLSECDACRARVVDAEFAAASLAAALRPMPPVTARRTWWTTVATAAAIVFAATTAFESISAHTASAQMVRTGAALGAIASSHFAHTTLTSEPGIVAKALYARDGSWVYVVAQNAPRDAHVVLRSGTASRDVGVLDAGAPATLFLRTPGRAAEISLLAGERVVAHGVPVY